MQILSSTTAVICDLWSPSSTLTAAEYSKLVLRRRRRTNQLRSKWGAVPPCHHKTEVITAVFHDWHPQPGLVCAVVCVANCISPVWQPRGRFSTNAKLSGRMLTTVSITWASLRKVQLSSVQFSLVWLFILQNYSTLRLRDKPWFMTD